MADEASLSHGEGEIYHRQGFGNPSGVGDRPALVIVDFVNGFADPTAFGGGNIRDAIVETQGLLGFARSANWPVAFTRVVFADDASDANVFTRKVPSLLSLTEENPQSAVVRELAPRPGELVLRKRLPSAFAGTDLAAWLTKHNVDTLVVAGATTSGCVRATVVDAMGSGFLVVVAADCVGDHAEGPHRASLFDMAQKYADLMTAQDIRKSFVEKYSAGGVK
ncbi:isochorismatase family protein [Bradyrhizobium ganzhouense]|uniref:isochorismatase family protein n=1 Tax=Bradyrhizobium ganzhouense TaxID=1179767 RepID=UPI003CF65859